MIASCGFLEDKDKVRQCSKEEGVTLADSVETLGVDLRTRVKRLGANEQARRRKCKVRLSFIQKNEVFQKKNEGVGQEGVTSGTGASKDLVSACSRFGSYRTIEIEEADGSSSGQKSTTTLSLFMEVYGLEVDEELSTLATQYWAEGVWPRPSN